MDLNDLNEIINLNQPDANTNDNTNNNAYHNVLLNTREQRKRRAQLINSRHKLKTIGALPMEQVLYYTDYDRLETAMKDAGLLHRPTEEEEMDVEAVIYFEERKENTLLHYKEVLKMHTDAMAEAARKSEIEWQDMYNEITKAEEKEKEKMTSEQKEKICNLVMKLKYEIEKEKIDLRYPALKPTE
jgi:hypothetical protein